MPFYGFPQKQVHNITVYVFGRGSIIRDTESLCLPQHNYYAPSENTDSSEILQ